MKKKENKSKENKRTAAAAHGTSEDGDASLGRHICVFMSRR